MEFQDSLYTYVHDLNKIEFVVGLYLLLEKISKNNNKLVD